MGIAIALLIVMLAAGAGGKSKQKPAGTKPTDKPKEEPVASSWTSKDDDAPSKSAEAAPTESGPKTFADLGSKLDKMTGSGLFTKPSPIAAPEATWPGLSSLPEPYRTNALDLVRDIPYTVAMGKTPAYATVSADTDKLYQLASKLDDVQKDISGFGTNVSGAIDELLKTARYMESKTGKVSKYRWGAAYGYT